MRAPTLTPRERAHLQPRAHGLEPVVQTGSAGVTQALIAEVERALTAHELIKVKITGEDRDARGGWRGDRRPHRRGDGAPGGQDPHPLAPATRVSAARRARGSGTLPPGRVAPSYCCSAFSSCSPLAAGISPRVRIPPAAGGRPRPRVPRSFGGTCSSNSSPSRWRTASSNALANLTTAAT
jgi:hypothetical protein